MNDVILQWQLMSGSVRFQNSDFVVSYNMFFSIGYIGKVCSNNIFNLIILSAFCHCLGSSKPSTMHNLIHVFIQISLLVRAPRDSRANLMPIYGDLYQIKL